MAELTAFDFFDYLALLRLSICEIPKEFCNSQSHVSEEQIKAWLEFELKKSVEKFGFLPSEKYLQEYLHLTLSFLNNPKLLILKSWQDGYFGSFMTINELKFRQLMKERLSISEVGSKRRLAGEGPFLNATHKALVELEFKSLEGEVLDLKYNSLSQVSFSHVPASDRIVLRSDNLPQIEALEAELVDLQEKIREDNDEEKRFGESRDLINQEIEIAKNIIGKPKFRLVSLIGWLTPMLKFLMDKFSGGVIAEAAKRLLSYLMDLI